MARSFYYSHPTARMPIGPYTAKELQRLAGAGQIRPTDVISQGREGRAIPAADFPGLFGTPAEQARSVVRRAPAIIKPARFSSRVVAVIIDSMLVAFLAVGLASLLSSMVPVFQLPSQSQKYSAALHGSTLIVGAVYSSVFESTLQATPGKMAVGAKIVGVDGQRLDGFRISLRGAVKTLGFGLFGGLPMLLALFRPDGRAVHDLISGSMVVRDLQV